MTSSLREKKGKWNVSTLEFLFAKFLQTSLTKAVLLAQVCWHASTVSLVTLKHQKTNYTLVGHLYSLYYAMYVCD